MEKIYKLSYYYDNGEIGDYYKSYEDHWYYSSLEIANKVFLESICKPFYGEYILSEVTLDTQKSVIINKSYYQENYYYNEDYYFDNKYDYDIDITPCWQEYEQNKHVEELIESVIIESWLTHKNEMYYDENI